MSENASAWLELFGRLHPLVLHLPIGMLVGLAAMEVVAMVRRKSVPREITRTLVVVTALSCVFAAGTGYFLGREGGDAGPTLIRHQQLGIALAAVCVLAAIVHLASASVRAWRVMLLSCLLLLAPVGHLGGSMTHGEGFITAPMARVLRATALALDPSGLPADRAFVQAATQPAPAAAPPDAVAETTVVVPVTAEVHRPHAVEPAVTPPPPPAAIIVPAALSDEAELFAQRLQPIFSAACTDCHGAERQKGGLALHALAALKAGGKSGPSFVSGRPAESELLRRLRLPESDKKRMPPAGKPQLTPEQIQAVEDWIAGKPTPDTRPPASGTPPEPVPAKPAVVLAAVAAQPVSAAAQPAVPPSPDASASAAPVPPVAQPAAPIPAPGPAALGALTEHLVHYEGSARDSGLLCINFAAAAGKTDDVLARRLLEPLLPNLETLALSQTRVGDQTAAMLAGASRLRRLDLRATAVTDSGVAALRNLPRLEELVLARTTVTDAAVEHIAAIPSLQRLFVWKAGLTPEGVASLKSRCPKLEIDVGEFQLSVAKEVEPEIKLTSDAPLPGQPPTASPPAAPPQLIASPPPAAVVAAASAELSDTITLQPVNTVCPVSGSPVDPRYVVVYKNRAIGFCCPKCPSEFWADPPKFESKLPPARPVASAGD